MDDAKRVASEIARILGTYPSQAAADLISAVIQKAVTAERERAKPQWTRDLPAAPGWYWVKRPGCLPEVWRVWKVADELPLSADGPSDYCDVPEFQEMGLMSCGPLEVPA